MNGDGVAQDYDAAMQRFLAADEAGNKKAARYVNVIKILMTRKRQELKNVPVFFFCNNL